MIILFIMPLTAEAAENNLIVEISNNGNVKIIHNLKPQPTVSAITVQEISDKISNILAIDENKIILDTIQQDNMIRIATLGASQVQLSYDSEITTNDSGIWSVVYTSDEESTIILPPLANIVSVNNIPLEMTDDSLVMPPGQISVSYIIRDIETQNFQVFSDGLSYTMQIMTGSQIDSFTHENGVISFNVDGSFPVLLMIPNSLISDTVEIFLNEKLIEHQNYFQDGSTSWIRIEPRSGGTIKIMEKMIPEEISQSSKGGGCLIATATYGSELTPQVQQLREIRDNSLLQTESGTSFMNIFNDVYYSFSPTIADYERENPVFKETVKIVITPMIASLSILNHVDMNSENSVLGYGISLIVLNLTMYIGIPVVAVVGIRKKL